MYHLEQWFGSRQCIDSDMETLSWWNLFAKTSGVRGTIGTDIAGVVVVVQLTAVYAESPDERLNVTTLLKH